MHSEPDLPPAGTLLPCQLDSYARSGTANVLACEPIAPPSKPAKAGKKAPKGASAVGSSAGTSGGSDQTSRWQITLSGGPLYPEGGGQPSDTGTLRLITSPPSPLNGSGAAETTPAAVQTDAAIGQGVAATGAADIDGNGAAQPRTAALTDSSAPDDPAAAVNVLSVVRSAGRVLATADAPLPVGATVAVSVDWDRRFDLMQQHTGRPSHRPAVPVLPPLQQPRP